MKNAVRLELKLNLDEDKIKETIKKRKSLEQSKLLVRRIITFVVNLIVLFSGWALIVLVNVYDVTIQNYFKQYYILKYIASFASSLCLSGIN